MAEWIDACAVDEVEEEDLIRFDHGFRTFVIVRDHAGNFYCCDGLCTHEKVHLSDGLVIEATIECPKHSSVFDAVTGKARTPPACENLRVYPTKVENDRVFIEI